MECPACHAENRESAKFCNHCGVTLEQACPACETTNPFGSRFCDACGQPLDAKLPSGHAVLARLSAPSIVKLRRIVLRCLTSAKKSSRIRC